MDHFNKVLMEKHAAFIKDWMRTAAKDIWSKVPGVKKYRQVKSDPVFKVKKAIGTGMLVGAPAAYLGSKMTPPRNPPGGIPQ